MFHRRAMVIDDDHDVRKFMKLVLSRYVEMDIDDVPSGNSGIEMAMKRAYDIVFVDYQMPGMNGLETCIELRKIQPSMIIIMISGNDFSVDERKQVLEHANALFDKPVSLQELVNYLRGILFNYAMHYIGGGASRPFVFPGKNGAGNHRPEWHN